MQPCLMSDVELAVYNGPQTFGPLSCIRPASLQRCPTTPTQPGWMGQVLAITNYFFTGAPGVVRTSASQKFCSLFRLVLKSIKQRSAFKFNKAKNINVKNIPILLTLLLCNSTEYCHKFLRNSKCSQTSWRRLYTNALAHSRSYVTSFVQNKDCEALEQERKETEREKTGGLTWKTSG